MNKKRVTGHSVERTPAPRTSRNRNAPLAQEAQKKHLTGRQIAARTGLAAIGLYVAIPVSIGAVEGFRDGLTAEGHHPHPNADFIENALRDSVLDKSVELRCVAKIPSPQSNEEELGSTQNQKNNPGKYRIHLERKVCRAIVEYARSDDKRWPDRSEEEALFSAVHESEHVDNKLKLSEAATQCIAFQKLPEFTKELGATQYESLQLQIDIADIYLEYPPEYRTAECHDGGQFDIDLNHKGIFPYPRNYTLTPGEFLHTR